MLQHLETAAKCKYRRYNNFKTLIGYPENKDFEVKGVFLYEILLVLFENDLG